MLPREFPPYSTVYFGLMQWAEQCPEGVERLTTVLADAGYRGETFHHWVWGMVGAKVEILANQTREFQLVAKRWVVERTFACFNLYRRLSKDYELLPEVSQSVIYAVMIHLTLRPLAPP
ncbi:MAG: hypothetical protein OHK0012_10800 [Synechococcales cyanobacterium]